MRNLLFTVFVFLVICMLSPSAKAVDNEVYTLFEDASIVDLALDAVPYTVDSDVSSIRDALRQNGLSVAYYLSLLAKDANNYSSPLLPLYNSLITVNNNLVSIYDLLKSGIKVTVSGGNGLSQAELNESLANYIINHISTYLQPTALSYGMNTWDGKWSVGDWWNASYQFFLSSLNRFDGIISSVNNLYSLFSSVSQGFNIFDSNGNFQNRSGFYDANITVLNNISQSSFLMHNILTNLSSALLPAFNHLNSAVWSSLGDDFTIVYDTWWVAIWRGVNMMRTVGMEYFYNRAYSALNSDGSIVSSLSWANSIQHCIYSIADVLTHWVDPDRVKLTESSRDSVKVVTDQIYGSGSPLSPSVNIGSVIGSAGDTVGLFGDASAAGGLGDAIDGVVSTDNGFAWFSAATRDNLDSAPQTFDLDPDSEDFKTHYYEDNRDEVLSFFSALGG